MLLGRLELFTVLMLFVPAFGADEAPVALCRFLRSLKQLVRETEMITPYWVAFRISETGNGAERYRAVVSAVHNLAAGDVWSELGTFVVFQSEANLKTVACRIEDAFDPNLDAALVGKPNFRQATAVGAVKEHSLFGVLPGTKMLRESR